MTHEGTHGGRPGAGRARRRGSLLPLTRRRPHAGPHDAPRPRPPVPVSREEFLEVLAGAGLRVGGRLRPGPARRGRWSVPELIAINTALEQLETRFGSPIGTVEDASVPLEAVLVFVNTQLRSGC